MRGTSATGVKEEHLNEAHIVDILSNEYSLEEILYQLARILFSQSLSQGNLINNISYNLNQMTTDFFPIGLSWSSRSGRSTKEIR